MIERDDEFKLLPFLASLAGLLGVVVALATATLLDSPYVFWPIGIALAIVFYSVLQRLHKPIKWVQITR